MAEKTLYLLDAFALIYRAYYGLGENFLINSKGQNTTAISLFTDSLNKLIQIEKPTHLAIAFDTAGPTDRAAQHEFYKANREEMPEGIKFSIPYIKKILKAWHIPILELEGYEADDVIGTLAKHAEKKGYKVYMVTPDKDFGQLVSENIFMYKPPFRGRPAEKLGVPEILEKWDISRIDQVIDMLGLMGDKVDNIPGIPGVGEKTAQKLLKEFDTIENILANTDKLKGKLKEKVEDNKEMAIISKELATIIIDAPVEYDISTFGLDKPDPEILTSLFAELEFRTLGKRILGDDYSVNVKATTDGQLDMFSPTSGTDSSDSSAVQEEKSVGKNISNTKHKYHLVRDISDMKDLAKKMSKKKEICFDSETTGLDANEAELVGMSFCWKKGEAYYVPIPADQKEAQKIVDIFKPVLEDKKIRKIAQNIKYDVKVLKWYDCHVEGAWDDTMIAHYILEPSLRHNMNFMAETYLGYSPVSIETLIGKKGKNQKSMRDIPPEVVVEYAGEDADITFQLHNYLKPKIKKKKKFQKLYEDIEVPIVRVLAQMEYDGVTIDTPFLEKYSKKMGKEILKTQENVFEMAGVEFNLGSPKQLGEVLFDKMKIEYKGKKTKTGQYSTNEETLRKLKDQPIVAEILGFRELSKLKSTYVDALPRLVNPKTNRVHTIYNQAVAATGRLSSVQPNLQNIPIRTDRGREIRKAFIPRSKDHILLSADYSQIELRIIAALSEDKNMMEAFNTGMDIHTATASRVYGVKPGEVDREMRGKAKMVNFGIIYGISAFGLGQRLGIPRKEAAELIEEYFEAYPKVKKFMEKSVEGAKKKGYVETILGRQRHLPDINSRNFTVRSFAERNAINSPIQGSAADMIKMAMIKIFDRIEKEGLKSKMILQVHDELVFDVLKSEKDHLKDMVEHEMSTAIKMKVPMDVESGFGQNWLEAH